MTNINELTVSNEIEYLIKDNKTYRFASELSHTQNNDRKEQLRTIVSSLQVKPVIDTTKDKISKMFNDVDKEIFKQPWAKLRNNHKEVKIKEYIEEHYNNSVNKKQLLELLTDALAAGHYKTNKHVDYNQKTSKITNIKNIIENPDDTYQLEIKPLKVKKTT